MKFLVSEDSLNRLGRILQIAQNVVNPEVMAGLGLGDVVGCCGWWLELGRLRLETLGRGTKEELLDLNHWCVR